MKPVNLNQLLFHPKIATLSFYLPPLAGDDSDFKKVEEFILDMQTQLQIQEQDKVSKLLEKNRAHIKKIAKSHPEKSHGFFLSDELIGYAILDNPQEPFCIIGSSFHVRPLLEEIFINPEFILINVSLFDIKIFKGDFQHLEVIQHYEFDQLNPSMGIKRAAFYTPQYLGLIPFKTILAMKTIAQKIMEFTLYQNIPIVVTGMEEMKTIFLRYFDHSVGVITHFQEDFFEKTCVQIQEKSKIFRFAVMDYYSVKLKDKLKRLTKSKRVITDLGEVIKATNSGSIIQLVIPSERKLWGLMNLETGHYELHKRVTKKNPSIDILNELAEEVIRQGGKIQILGPHFFPSDAFVMAILKG